MIYTIPWKMKSKSAVKRERESSVFVCIPLVDCVPPASLLCKTIVTYVKLDGNQSSVKPVNRSYMWNISLQKINHLTSEIYQ